MSNRVILDVASQGSPGVEGTPVNMSGGKVTAHIQADSYGTDGKIVLKASANTDNTDFITLEDPLTASGLAEYSANTSKVIDFLPTGWLLRADLVIGTGTFTNALVVVGG